MPMQANSFDPRPKQGRPPQVEIPAEDLTKLRDMYMRTNRNRTDGSKVLAARLLAKQGELSAPVAAAILKPRASKALPSCIANAMHVAPQVFAVHRHSRNADLGGIYCPGCLRMTLDENGDLRRLHPGERQSWDDATINFGVVIPWPWGGDKCADRYGVKLGRFQLLTCVDDASDFCPGFSFVIREMQSYRAEDVCAAQFRLASRTYQPQSYMLEGGCWQSARARAFHDAAGVRIEDATGRPHSKLVESFFNRLWSVLSPLPGNVGRFRGEQDRESKLYIACRQGRQDPRKHFPTLNQALLDIGFAISYLNDEPIHSTKYGRWVPREMHNEWLAEHPLPRMNAALALHASPVREQRTIRRGMLRLTCRSPYGESFRYHFAEEMLWQFEGASVHIHFDPWAEDSLEADIVLEKPFRGHPAGKLLCRAVCIEDAPMVRQAAEGVRVDLLPANALAMRNAARAAVRREHRVIGAGGRVESFAAELRAPGELRIAETITNSGTDNTVGVREGSRVHADAACEGGLPDRPVFTPPARRENWRDRMPDRMALEEQEYQAAIRRGEVVPA